MVKWSRSEMVLLERKAKTEFWTVYYDSDGSPTAEVSVGARGRESQRKCLGIIEVASGFLQSGSWVHPPAPINGVFAGGAHRVDGPTGWLARGDLRRGFGTGELFEQILIRVLDIIQYFLPITILYYLTYFHRIFYLPQFSGFFGFYLPLVLVPRNIVTAPPDIFRSCWWHIMPVIWCIRKMSKLIVFSNWILPHAIQAAHLLNETLIYFI